MLTIQLFEVISGWLEAVTSALLGYAVDAINTRITDALLRLFGLDPAE